MSGEYYPPTPFFTSVRFRLSLVCFLGFAVLYGQRVNLSIAMVCMVKPVTQDGNATDLSACARDSVHHETRRADFDWSKELQGNILGSFFYGYLVLQLPGGMLSEQLGAKHVVTAGMLPVAILTLLTPVLTHASYILLIVTRIIIGLGEAVMYPAAVALWGVWSPPKERTKLVGISLSGGQFGNALILPIGGLLCSCCRWESVFYFIGGFGLFFCLVWILWVSNDPAKHSGLSKAELNYLQSVIQPLDAKPPSTPWKQIFFCPPVLACYVAHVCGNYAYYMNLTQIPTYMKEVLKFNIKANGALSMVPYLVFWALTMVMGMVSDAIVNTGVAIGTVRKIFGFIGLVGPAVFLVATSYITCEAPYVAVVMLVLAVGFTSFGFTSYMVNHGDLAPMYAGTLFGVSNTLATIPGILAPYIVGVITRDGTPGQWQTAFIIAAVINCIGAVVYVMFASGQVQPWAAVEPVVIVPSKKKMSVLAAPMSPGGFDMEPEETVARKRTHHARRASVVAMATV